MSPKRKDESILNFLDKIPLRTVSHLLQIPRQPIKEHCRNLPDKEELKGRRSPRKFHSSIGENDKGTSNFEAGSICNWNEKLGGYHHRDNNGTINVYIHRHVTSSFEAYSIEMTCSQISSDGANGKVNPHIFECLCTPRKSIFIFRFSNFSTTHTHLDILVLNW